MLQELSCWPDKLLQGKTLAQEFFRHYHLLLPKQINKVLFVGLGGSGIAGLILKALLRQPTSIPCEVVQGYDLPPRSTAPGTLAIVCSYSGTTWEVLAHLEDLVLHKTPLLVITHSQQLATQLCARHIPVALIPPSLTPRSSLGHVLGFCLELCNQLDILPGNKLTEIFLTHTRLHLPQLQKPDTFEECIHLVQQNPLVQVWGVTGDSAAYAYRTQTQLNENAKLSACTAYLPEICHNLIEGLVLGRPAPSILLMHTKSLASRVSKTVEGIAWLAKQQGVGVYKPPVFGDTYQSQFFYGLLWGDFASVHVGNALGVDTVNVPLIQTLKTKVAS